MLIHIIFLIIGLVFLVWGAEWLVRGASKLARVLGISPLAIGLTIVAYGTSAPELVVNISSILAGKDDIAFGNIVGSNIFNILFILGLCALISPLKITSKIIKFDVPIMISASVALYIFSTDYNLSRLESMIFILGIVIYTFFCFFDSKKEGKAIQEEYNKEFGIDRDALKTPKQLAMNGLFIIMGLGLLVMGSRWLVQSSVAIARYFEVGELVIGLTIVAVGTSLPEVATSIIATIKGERDIAVGNVLGSSIFNILGILGVTGLIPRSGMAVNPDALVLDIPFMLIGMLLCYPFFSSQSTLSRREGFVFLSMYVGYTAFLIISS